VFLNLDPGFSNFIYIPFVHYKLNTRTWRLLRELILVLLYTVTRAVIREGIFFRKIFFPLKCYPVKALLGIY